MPFGLGMSSQLGIGIAIELQDRFSGRAAKVNQSINLLKQNAHSAVTSAIRDYRNQSLAIAATAGAASMAMFNMAKSGAEFQHSINQIAIVGGKELGKTREQLSGFAQDLSRVFTRDPMEISRAMFENVKQGVTNGLEEITKYQVAVAAATDEQLEGTGGVANNLLSIMHTMDLPISKFKDISNIVASVANSTQASVYSIGEAMQYGAFTAHQFNLPLITTAALFGKISQSGIPGSRMGTAVNNMLTHLGKSLGPFRTKRQLEAWQMLGLDPNQLRTMSDSGNITGVIKAVSDATSKLSPSQKGSILPQLFNMRGTVGVEALFDSKHGNKTIAEIIRAAEAAQKQNLVMQQSKAMMNDLHSDFIFMASAFHRFRIAFTKAAEPTLRFMMKVGVKVMSFISSIINNPIGKVLAGIATVVIPTIGVLFAFRAALFTATLALRGFNARQFMGGGSSLLAAGLDLAGNARFGNGAVKMNKAGKFYAGMGGIFPNASGGFKRAGTLLSKAEIEGMGLTAGRGIGILGGIAGMMGRLLPWVGAIMLGVEVLKMLGIHAEAQHREAADHITAQYYKNLDEAYYAKAYKDSRYLSKGSSMKENAEKFSQQIQINIDGKEAMTNQIQSTMENHLNTAINMVMH